MDISFKKGRNDSEAAKDKKISIALMASFVVLTIQYFILISFSLIETPLASRIQLLSKALVGLLFLYALPVVWKRSKAKFVYTYFIAVFVFLFHYGVFAENRIYLRELLFPVFFTSLPAFIYSLSIYDFSVLKATMKKASFGIFVMGVFLAVLIFAGKASVGIYSMTLSYYLLLPAILFVDELLEKASLKALVYTVTSLFIILALGSRGAVLCIVIFALFKFFRSHGKLTFVKAMQYLSLTAVGLFIYVFLEEILEYIFLLLLRFGIQSRTLLLFLENDVHLSGRDSIYENMVNEIINKPLLGIGLAGDRHISGNTYAHNFFIEVLGDFGIIIGGIISAAIVVLIIGGLLSKDKNNYNTSIIWISLGFVHLMFSSSYLIDIKFWIFMGLIININARNYKVAAEENMPKEKIHIRGII